MLRYLAIGCLLAVPMGCSLAGGGRDPAASGEAPARAPRSGPWPAEAARDWFASREWLVGCNFIPSTAVNQLEMWQAGTFDPETIDRELGYAETLGFNVVRVYLHDLAYAEDPEGFLERVDEYLSIAHARGIETLLVIFDDVWRAEFAAGEQPDPLPGVHNSGWVQSPGFERVRAFAAGDAAVRRRLEAYVRAVLTRFADDERILGWDLYNEPGNTAHVGSFYMAGGAPEHSRGPRTDAESLALLQATFAWAWDVNPIQPLTCGPWAGHLEEISAYSLEASDFISFHNYGGPEGLERQIESLEARPGSRPIVCTEYMARHNESTFEGALPVFARHGVGAINWGLVAGKTNTIYPWGSWREPGKLPEPDLWFHDIFRKDGTPFREEEVAFIRRIIRETRAAKESKS